MAALAARSMVFAAILLFSAPALAGRVRYTVAPGDTLGGIAAEYDVSISDLRRWNDLSGDTIWVGQRLTIHTRGSSSERLHEEVTVRSGDTGLGLARRHRVSVTELRRWNPSVDLDRIRPGQTLSIYVDGGGASASRGAPNRGRLRGGVQLPDGNGWIVRRPDRAYGTDLTVSVLGNGIARVRARYIDVPDLVVQDLSYENGGPMSPHSSHQNGRDADVTYYQVDSDDVSEWQAVAPDDLDVQPQWYLFRSWIEQGAVEYIFVDASLQVPMYEYARSRGATDEQLDAWFEYPSGGGVIRHEPGHDDHFHVRFVEPE